MNRWPLSAKLTAWSVLVVGLGTLLLAVSSGEFLRHEQIELLDIQLKGEAQRFFNLWDSRSDLPIELRVAEASERLLLPGTSDLFVVRDRNQNVIFRSFEDAHLRLPGSTLGIRTIKLRAGAEYRLGTFQHQTVSLSIATPLQDVEADGVERFLAVAPVVPCLLVLAGLGGWWIARKALGPVAEITREAEAITADRLDRRLAAATVDDEIGRLTRVLNDMLDRLEKGFHQAARFSADASHELKTPLTVLRVSIEDLLGSPDLSESDRAAVAGLLEQTRRLAGITETLVLLSRAESGRLELDPQTVNLSELVEACAGDAEILADGRGISIETVVPPNLVVQLDRDRVNQILWNLLDNAIKYNRPNGRISVHAGLWQEKETVWILIGNSGQGIDPGLSAQVFARFFRNDNCGVPGRGLGLSLSRELARAHGGDIEIVRTDPDWTEFRLTLCSLADENRAMPESSGEDKVPSWSNGRKPELSEPFA
ncbi:MAG: HAMP domain-containing protein [Verrucomicrobia bacterium]|nr:HAMP domain-containing protein [Verrucomicrobiota bacterium]